MFENDYIMRMIMDIVTMIRKSWNLPDGDENEFIDDIEDAVGDAVSIDPELFFSLEPDSAVALLEMSDMDEDLALYVTRAMFLEAKMLEAEGNVTTAHLRRKQATAIAKKYGVEVPGESETAEGLVQLFLHDPEEEEPEQESESETPEQEDVHEEAEKRASALGISLDKMRF